MVRLRDFRGFSANSAFSAVFQKLNGRKPNFGNLKILNENIDYNNGLAEKKKFEISKNFDKFLNGKYCRLIGTYVI